MTTAMARDLRDAHMEIGGHTVSHPHLTTLDAAQVHEELFASKKALEHKLKVHIEDFASPFGETNGEIRAQIMSGYASHRTVSGGTNTRDFTDLSRLHGRLVTNTTTVADVTSWLTRAKEEGSWLILIFHDIHDDPGPYETTPALFRKMIDAVERSGLAVRTVAQARTEIVPQLND
jgi:peptidoglycan/xylan/chitin deacetylase (PgdA/CDA1 family)